MKEKSDPRDQSDPRGSDGILGLAVIPELELPLWTEAATQLGVSVGMVFRLCAISGLIHHFEMSGQKDKAAWAGAFARVYTEQAGLAFQTDMDPDAQKKIVDEFGT